MQNKHFDINEEGYSIRCLAYFNKDLRQAKKIVIATYGFGGNKENHAISTFADRLIGKYKSFAVITFDWPCHGQDARKKLLLSECLKYLDLVIRYVKEEMGAEEIDNYSSSFGAFITLDYLAKKGNPFHRIGLRCPAIKMYEALTMHFTEDDWSKLHKGKEILQGFERKMEIGNEFLEEMQTDDVTKQDYLDYADSILMIHGTNDEMVPIEVTRQFSGDNVIELIEVEGADHPFSNPKHMDLAIQKIISFFKPE